MVNNLTIPASELRHARHVFVRFWNAEDGVLVTVERDRAAVLQQIAFQCFEIAERALGCDEAQLHQRAGGVVDEDEQGAGITPILEPTVV